MRVASVVLGLVISLTALCLLVWGEEGSFPQWFRGLMVVAGLLLVILAVREKRDD